MDPLRSQRSIPQMIIILCVCARPAATGTERLLGGFLGVLGGCQVVTAGSAWFSGYCKHQLDTQSIEHRLADSRHPALIIELMIQWITALHCSSVHL